MPRLYLLRREDGRSRSSVLNKAGRRVSEGQVRFEDFVLQFDTSSRGGFRARVLRSPFGEGGVGFSLSPLASAEPVIHGTSSGFRDVGSSETASSDAKPAVEVGIELYRSVFQGQVRTLLDKTRGQLEISPDLGLRLKIKIDPGDEEAGILADLPWELLHDRETEDFFALSRRTSIVRYLDVPRSSQPIQFTAPLRILAVGASPGGMQALDLEAEMGYLENLNRSSAGIEVRFLNHASAGAVRQALAEETINVLHFMGHGTFDRSSGEGMLAFEAADGSAELVSGRAFATKLRDVPSLGVVLLNACNTARAGREGGASPFRGVATALVLGGVPAVVAMQRPISDVAAIGFSSAFYRHLARGDAVDVALTEGRQAIHSAKPDSFEWATPVLFLRIPEGNVFVASPAKAPEAPTAPLPVLEEPAAHPRTAKNKRGFQIGAAAVGAALMIYVVYPKISAPGSDSPQQTVTEPTATSTQSSVAPEPKPKSPTGRHSTTGTGEPQTTTKIVEKQSQGTKPQDAPPRQDSVVVPPPVSPPTTGTTEVEPETVDLSKLTAQVTGIARREGGGLRVTVNFKNASDRPLSVDLDADLSDQSLRYKPLNSGPKLKLAVGDSSHTLDFPAPKLGSTKFYLFLRADDGTRIQVTSGSPIDLP